MSRIVEALQIELGQAVISVEEGFGPVTVEVGPQAWVAALRAASDASATYLDFLTAYDLDADGFMVLAHVSAPNASDHVLLRTRVARDLPRLDSATQVYRGAAWHERETAEMFGLEFTRHHPGDEGEADRLHAPLLLSPSAPSAPLRKDVVLVERPSRPWPGSKDPTDSAGRSRRRVLPPGVPAVWPPESEDGDA